MSKRKRNRDMRCVLFPDDVTDTFTKRGKESAKTSIQATKSWDRCGDSFLDTSVIQNLQTSEKKSSGVRKVAPASITGNTEASTDEPVHIAWSSSEEEESNNDNLHPPRSTVLHAPQPSRPHKQHPIDYYRCLRMLSAGVDTDDLPSIDSDSELEEENSTSKEQIDFVNPVASPAEISDYSSNDDEDPDESRTNSSVLDPADSSKQSVSEWVRSAQAILQTPQKLTAKSIKTPEDSSKKRRKFERGGFAERLNRLHSRQRSAISFWRHQCSSNTSAADRPGVLTLRILGVQEECGMQAALCDRLPETEKCVALFSKDTAAQLQPMPGDIVHIYPPWQNLVVEGEIYPIILNTHFSQKFCMDTKSDNNDFSESCGHCEEMPTSTVSQVSVVRDEQSVKRDIHSQLSRVDGRGIRNSLLDTVEECGSSGSQSGPVEVLVQRVYCIPIMHSLNRASLQHRMLGRPPPESAPPAHIGRLCALVQDHYGMFSEIVLQCVSTESEVQQNCEQLEGRVCVLQAVRVVQRLTRDRCSQLFSMIDSLWPPLVDPKTYENLPQSPSDRVPAPSFCYRLSVQQGHMVPISEQTVSPLYRPTVLQTLKEILQVESVTSRRSFRATVVHKQLLRSNAGEREMLLFVTDPSLQTEPRVEGNRRTVAVCLSPSCLIQSTVTQALDGSQQRPILRFKDAMKENGQIFCWEQTVIQLEPEDPCFSIPQPIMLDQLGPETLPYSLCTLTGVIVEVDESTAFSWPTCSRCAGCHLEITQEQQKGFLCLMCGTIMEEPTTKMQLEVCLSCPLLSHCTVKIKLQQNTIMSLLNSARSSEGYSVENVLGMEIGPLNAFVHVVNRSHTVWVGLEELNL
ncbi:DNA repair-scaffolding protein [Myxocyprinus asiaticus]|uniref:DNA repair-scaffolding protein n=1 Tax=Myxocyprinus asiaticus TaxID=70543 RepID=UPI0022236240|nr:DNA repair-scaffolding protein [Myxocyprinus asiaticus]